MVGTETASIFSGHLFNVATNYFTYIIFQVQNAFIQARQHWDKGFIGYHQSGRRQFLKIKISAYKHIQLQVDVYNDKSLQFMQVW